ncbi:hypothetical protein BH10CYA1_BH10CYA1_12140 [soil metagenome]
MGKIWYFSRALKHKVEPRRRFSAMPIRHRVSETVLNSGFAWRAKDAEKLK